MTNAAFALALVSLVVALVAIGASIAAIAQANRAIEMAGRAADDEEAKRFCLGGVARQMRQGYL